LIGQQAGEAAVALVVDGARHAHSGGAHAARGQSEQRIERAGSAGDRSFEGQRILLPDLYEQTYQRHLAELRRTYDLRGDQSAGVSLHLRPDDMGHDQP
jgi:hypothetical protein